MKGYTYIIEPVSYLLHSGCSMHLGRHSYRDHSLQKVVTIDTNIYGCTKIINGQLTHGQLVVADYCNIY